MKNKTKNIILAVSIPILLILFIQQYNRAAAQQKSSYRDNENYRLQTELYDVYKLKQADIVMLGDSRTYGANWNELLGRNSIANRGVTMDVLEGFAGRMSYIYKLNPRICFINGGINDIFSWTAVDKIFAVYIKIIAELKSRNIIPVISSTVFAAKDYGKAWKGTPEGIKDRNNEITKLNRLLSDYAKANKLDYFDFNQRLITVDNYLRPEVTWDGLHFKAAAYKIWAEEVEKILIKYKL